MAGILEAIKLIGALIGVFKTIYQLVRDFQRSQREKTSRDAYEDLKNAQTPEQVQEANRNIVNSEH